MAKKQTSENLEMKTEDLYEILAVRFKEQAHRFPSLSWEEVRDRLRANPERREALEKMESSGGSPAPMDWDKKTGAIFWVDFSPESPSGRRSLCFDQDAWESRKANKPSGSVEQWVQDAGAELLDEETYLRLQERGAFDQKTSSWIKTPDALRSKGGALFGDHRFGRTFIYHNGAESYYAARGFRVGVWI